jgi:hypothetical protein
VLGWLADGILCLRYTFVHGASAVHTNTTHWLFQLHILTFVSRPKHVADNKVVTSIDVCGPCCLTDRYSWMVLLKHPHRTSRRQCNTRYMISPQHKRSLSHPDRPAQPKLSVVCLCPKPMLNRCPKFTLHCTVLLLPFPNPTSNFPFKRRPPNTKPSLIVLLIPNTYPSSLPKYLLCFLATFT